MKYDVIVVGSGLGGLECASILSRSGLSVLVLEKGAQAGGCMQSYCRRGMWYDTGFHYVGGLGEGQSLYAPFRYLGLLDLPWKRLDFCFDRISVGGRNFVFAEGFDEFARMLAEDFPAERSALCEYASLLRRAGEERFLSPGMSAGEADLLSPMSGVGAYSYLSEKFRDPLLVDVLSGASLKMELRKESLPLFTFVHGNSSFIVWSRIFINGTPFLQMRENSPRLTALNLDDLQEQVKRAGDIEVDGKGCTEFGIANVAVMLIKAIFHDQKLIWPCSTALNGEYGQKDVAAGVPCVIGKNGLEQILEVELDESEKEKFAKSCDIIRGFLERAESVK